MRETFAKRVDSTHRYRALEDAPGHQGGHEDDSDRVALAPDSAGLRSTPQAHPGALHRSSKPAGTKRPGDSASQLHAAQRLTQRTAGGDPAVFHPTDSFRPNAVDMMMPGPDWSSLAFCTQCGKPLPDNAAFCSACGSPVHENANADEQEETSSDSSSTAPAGDNATANPPPDPEPTPAVPAESVVVCTVCGNPLEPGTSTCPTCGTPREGSTTGDVESSAPSASRSSKRTILIASIAGIAAVVAVGAWFAWQSFANDDSAETALPPTITVTDQTSTAAPSTTAPTATTTTTSTTPTTTTTVPTTTTTLPSDLLSGLVDTGVFVGPGSGADPAVLQASVEIARVHGWDLSVVALSEAPEGATSEYAASIAAATNAGTVVVVTPTALGWANRGAEVGSEELSRAWSLIPAGSSETVAVRTFVTSVLGGPDSVGVVNSGTGQWGLVRADNTIASFAFGEGGDVPFMGDWDCDGIATPGVFRPASREVFLRNSSTEGPSDISYVYGVEGALPIAGDFDGDGCDTVSFYSPGDGSVRIFNTHEMAVSESEDSTPFDTAYVFGDAGDVAFVGDFDGDGVDTLGLYRPSSGMVYLKNSHVEGPADLEFQFGDAGDLPVSGDWGPEDGIDTVALYRPDTGVFYFRFTNSAGPPDATLETGAPGGQPVAGAFGLNRTG